MSGGGSSSPLTQTISSQGVSNYAQPAVNNLLNATQSQIFNTDASGNVTGMQAYQPYSQNAQDYVAGPSPLQQQAYYGASAMQTPYQYDIGSNLAKQAGYGGLNAQYNPIQAGYNWIQGAQANAAQLGNAPQAQAAQGYGQNMQAAQGYAQDMQSAQLGNTPQAQAAQFGGPQNVSAQQVNAPQINSLSMQAAGNVSGPNLQNYQMGPASQVNTQNYTGQNVQDYMSPYLEGALKPQLAEANRNYDISAAQQQSRATQSGAFGGGREAVMAAENERNRNTALNQIYGTGYQNAFQNAQQQFNAQQNANLQAQQANQQAGLTVGQQNLGANLGVQQLGANLGQQAALANQANQQQANLQNLSAGLQTQGLAAQTGLQAQQANQQAGLQAGLANQQVGYNTGLQNAQLAQQAALANQQIQGQYGLQQGQFNQAANQANQQARNQFGIANLSNQQQANAANQQAGNQFGMANLTNQQQANIANQALQGQYGLQQGQFNQATNQLNAQQQQAANLANQQAALQAQQANINQQQFGANYGLQGLQQANQAASTLGGLGAQQYNAQAGILGLQNTLGNQQQQNEQQIINAAIQNQQTAQQYPFQQLNYLKNALSGLPIQTQMQQQYQAAPSILSQLGGLGTTAIAGGKLAGVFKKGGVVKMAGGGIASGVPPGKLQSMLKDLSDQQLAQKANPKASDIDTLAAVQGEQAFRANARANMPVTPGFAPGGIVAFAEGGKSKKEAYAGESEDDELINNIMMSGMSGGMNPNYVRPQEYTSPPVSKPQAQPQPQMQRVPVKGVRGDIMEKGSLLAKEYGVPENLIHHILSKETGNLANPETAVSRAGAKGVMQLMPATAKELGVKNPFDVNENMRGGVSYFSKLYSKYQDPKLAAMAYNWGPGNVDKWLKAGGDMNKVPKETYNYVQGLAKGGAIKHFDKGGEAEIYDPMGGGVLYGDSTRKPGITSILKALDPKHKTAEEVAEEWERKYGKNKQSLPNYNQDVPYSPTAAAQPISVPKPPSTAPVQNQGITAPNLLANRPDLDTGMDIASETTKQMPSQAPEPDRYNALMEKIENQYKNAEGQKEQDKWLSILQAGLGMMSGTSPYAMANIGAGGQKGIAAYAESRKQRNEEQRDALSQMIGLQKVKGLEDYQKRMADITGKHYEDTTKLRGKEVDLTNALGWGKLNVDAQNIALQMGLRKDQLEESIRYHGVQETQNNIQRYQQRIGAIETQAFNNVNKSFDTGMMDESKRRQLIDAEAARLKAEDPTLKDLGSRLGYAPMETKPIDLAAKAEERLKQRGIK